MLDEPGSLESFNEWVNDNEDYILECYQNSEPEAPEIIYEGVLDDDYPDVYVRWLSSLTIDDVPDDFVWGLYDSLMEGE